MNFRLRIPGYRIKRTPHYNTNYSGQGNISQISSQKTMKVEKAGLRLLSNWGPWKNIFVKAIYPQHSHPMLHNYTGDLFKNIDFHSHRRYIKLGRNNSLNKHTIFFLISVPPDAISCFWNYCPSFPRANLPPNPHSCLITFLHIQQNIRKRPHKTVIFLQVLSIPWSPVCSVGCRAKTKVSSA